MDSTPIQQNIHGDHNVQNIYSGTSESLPEKVAHLCEELDSRVNAKFPKGCVSPTLGQQMQAFQAAKIFSSLAILRVPPKAIFLVVNSLVNELLNIPGDTLHTNVIRRSIVRQLYSLEPSLCTSHERQEWGDMYVRRYGHDGPVQIIFEGEANVRGLTFEYVIENLIPEMLASVMAKSQAIFRPSGEDGRRMADVIIDRVRGLNIYRIHFKTLLCISTDLALQPPHPWIVRSAYDDPTISYDIERVVHHGRRMFVEWRAGNRPAMTFSILECIRHASSGILAYYGQMMGCGHLAPFYNLLSGVRKLEARKETEQLDPEIYGSELVQLPHDLTMIGIDMRAFATLLKHLEGDISKLGEPNLDADITQLVLVHVKALAKVCRAVIRRREIAQHLLKKERWDGYPSISPASVRILFEAVFGKSRRQRGDSENQFWIKLIEPARPIPEMKSFALVTIAENNALLQHVEEKMLLLDRRSAYSNTMFVIVDAASTAECGLMLLDRHGSVYRLPSTKKARTSSWQKSGHAKKKRPKWRKTLRQPSNRSRSSFWPLKQREKWQRQEPTNKNATFSEKSPRTRTCSIVSFGLNHAERGNSL